MNSDETTEQIKDTPTHTDRQTDRHIVLQDLATQLKKKKVLSTVQIKVRAGMKR